jgi:hypothetical protein
VARFTLRPLYPHGKSHWNPWDRRLGGFQSRSGCSDIKNNSQPLLGFDPPIIQLVAQRYTIEPSRFLVTFVWMIKTASENLDISCRRLN